MHVTVLIPAWNTAQYIGECLASVLSQSHKNFDILVVDDGSSDDTVKVVERFLPGNPISLTRVNHAGVTHATAEGIKQALGPVITIVDSDDKLLPNALKYGAAPFVDPDVGFVWTMFETSKGKRGWSHPLPAGMSLYRALMDGGWWKASHQRFFRKATYEKGVPLNTAIDRASDYQLALLLGLTGCKTVHVPAVTYWYRMGRNGSITSNGSHRQRQAVGEIRAWIRTEIERRGIKEPV